MKNTWITKDGEEIPYSKIETSHLINIIKYVKRLAKKLDGQIIDGGGVDLEDIWYEIGDEGAWLKKLGYAGLVRELKKGELQLRIFSNYGTI